MLQEPDHFILFHDSDGWCTAPPNFCNLIEDPTGWGETPEQSILDLLRDPVFHDRMRDMPGPVDFIDVSEPDGAKVAVAYDPATGTMILGFGTA